MAINASTLQSLVSISQFSKGQATKVFDRLRNESQLVVLKNNKPAAILLSPEEFSRLAEIEENYGLKTTAIVTMAEVVEHLYNREYKGRVVIDDALKAEIDAYYAEWGVKK